MENIKLAVTTVLSNYVNFQGRATRAEFWWWVLAAFVASIICNIVDAIIGIPLFGIIFSLGVILPNLAVGARRLHDTGRTGWWLLIGLIPLVGFIVLIIFTVQPSEQGDNRFGVQPRWPIGG